MHSLWDDTITAMARTVINMKRFRSKIYQIKNGETLGITEYVIEATSKGIAWEESIKLAYDKSLFSVNIMVYIEEDDTLEKEERDIYDLF